MSLPVIAIVGRPNVGKSTLFNRLIGERRSVTSSKAGTTRDRVYHEAEMGSYRTILVDTAGLAFEKKKSIEADMQAQARIAVTEADVVLFVLDATQTLTASDYDTAQLLRKSRKKLILVANKADAESKKAEENMPLLHELGLGEALPVSSIHSTGILELGKAVSKLLKKLNWQKMPARKTSEIHIAIAGKPNVGKSSLVNALIGENRLIVSPIPGTTIDATDTPFTFQGDKFVLIDTAGLRRRGKVERGVEHYSVLRSLKAISRADVTCLVLNFEEGIANQDMHVSEYILEAGTGLVIVVNKCDRMTDPIEDRKAFLNNLHYRMSYLPWAPVLFVSALTRKNTAQIFELCKNIRTEREKKVLPAEFALFTKTTVLSHPPMRSGQLLKITKGEQTSASPPRFTFYTNKPDLIHFSYRRFLENEIRRKYGFYGTPIILHFRKI